MKVHNRQIASDKFANLFYKFLISNKSNKNALPNAEWLDMKNFIPLQELKHSL